MASVLRELDHGPAALPRGSEVVLFNQHAPPDQLPSVRVCLYSGSAPGCSRKALFCSSTEVLGAHLITQPPQPVSQAAL